MKNIAIIGSGGLGREVLGIIDSINNKSKVWNFIGFFDDNPCKEFLKRYTVIGTVDDLNSIKEELFVIIGVGSPSIKKTIFNKIDNPKIKHANLIHPSVVLYSQKTINLGKGIVIGANSVLTVDISIGDFVYLNTGVILSHDSSVGSFSMLMPSVSISTGVNIGESVYIGNGAIIDKPIKINSNTIIKAGSILSE